MKQNANNKQVQQREFDFLTGISFSSLEFEFVFKGSKFNSSSLETEVAYTYGLSLSSFSFLRVSKFMELSSESSLELTYIRQP